MLLPGRDDEAPPALPFTPPQAIHKPCNQGGEFAHTLAAKVVHVDDVHSLLFPFCRLCL